MSKRKNKKAGNRSGNAANAPGMITISGNMPRPGQTAPGVVIQTAPRRFGVDISDYMTAIRSAENVDTPNRTRLYDLYADILMDAHLSCVIDKRINAVLCSDIEFRRDGKPDDTVNEQIRSPWFNRLVRDILGARFWGFTLCQFYRDGDWIDYVLVPRKHACPVRRIIKRNQSDTEGISWEEYEGLLFAGAAEDLGLLAKAAPWVIYKRNSTGDWSQFSEVFGMPIQEYIYDSDDDDSRQRAIEDARNIGSLATFVHGKDSSLNLIESGNKSGSADVYERLIERCNSEISKLILGNTLTTEASDTGTQALGTVHKKVEDKVEQADRLYVLDVLNYDMTDIFAGLGINTAGGEFCFPERKDLDPTSKVNILVQLHQSYGLPISDDYLYEEFGIDRPDNYDQLKAEAAAQAEADRAAGMLAMGAQIPADDDTDPDNNGSDDGPHDGGAPPKTTRQTLKNALRSFFGLAPDAGADDW